MRLEGASPSFGDWYSQPPGWMEVDMGEISELWRDRVAALMGHREAAVVMLGLG